MLGKKQTSTMYLRSSFHHRSKLAPFFLFYRKLIDEIECIRDLFLLVFESSGLCLSAFIILQIMFKWFKKFAMAYRRYGCCPHWEFIIVHVDACHLNLNCQPKSAFYCFSIDFFKQSIWKHLVHPNNICTFPFILSFSFIMFLYCRVDKAIIYIHGLDTGETLNNAIYFVTWNRESRPRPVTWEKAVNHCV